MILIAENLNSSIPKVHQALEARNSGWIRETAACLAASSADYLDVNAGTFFDGEISQLLYLIGETIQVCRKPLVLDSPDPAVIRQAAAFLADAGWKPELPDSSYPRLILNSITLEEKRYGPMLETALANQAGLITLLMDEQRMPSGVDERLDIAGRIITKLTAAGIPAGHIFLDPMIRPVSTDDQAGREALAVIRLLKENFPVTHVVIGLSNVSFGLPARRYLNRALLLMAMASGLDSAILNPLDQELMSLYRAAVTMGGQDEYCLEYLECFRP